MISFMEAYTAHSQFYCFLAGLFTVFFVLAIIQGIKE